MSPGGQKRTPSCQSAQQPIAEREEYELTLSGVSTPLCGGSGRNCGGNEGMTPGETPTTVIEVLQKQNPPPSLIPKLHPSMYCYFNRSHALAVCPWTEPLNQMPDEVDRQLTCPCCSHYPLSDYIQSPSMVTVGISGSLSIVCGACEKEHLKHRIIPDSWIQSAVLITQHTLHQRLLSQ